MAPVTGRAELAARYRAHPNSPLQIITMTADTPEIAIDLTEIIAAYMLQLFEAKLKDKNSRVDFPDGWSRELLGDVDWMVHTLLQAFKNQSTGSLYMQLPG